MLRYSLIFTILLLSAPLSAWDETPANPSKPQPEETPKTTENLETPKPGEGTEPKTEEGTEPKTEEGTEPKTEEGTEPKTEEGTEPKTEEKLDPIEEWATLARRRVQIGKTLADMRKQYLESKDKKTRDQIHSTMFTYIFEFNNQLYPRMSELAPVVYEKQPKNLLAADFTLERKFKNNEFDEVVELGNKLLEDGRKSATVYNSLGGALFALQKFDEAEKILEAGKKLKRLNSRSEDLLLAAEDYPKHWEKEAELRKQEAAAEGDDQLPRVLLKTSKGEIELELFENEAPNTVSNFVTLVEAKTYDGVRVHAILPFQYARMGNPDTKKDYEEKKPYVLSSADFTIKCECFRPDARKHFRGSLSMANPSKDQGAQQFVITVRPTPERNARELAGVGSTVFGRVVKGMDVVDSLQKGDTIESATVTRKRDHDYKPERTEKPTAPGRPTDE